MNLITQKHHNHTKYILVVEGVYYPLLGETPPQNFTEAIQKALGTIMSVFECYDDSDLVRFIGTRQIAKLQRRRKYLAELLVTLRENV